MQPIGDGDKDDPLDRGEQPFVLFSAGPEVEQRAGQVEHCRQQQEFRAARQDHKSRIQRGDAGNREVAVALLRSSLVGLAAPRNQKPISRDQQVRDQRHRARQFEHQRKRVLGEQRADHEELDNAVAEP